MKNKSFTPILIALIAAFNLTVSVIIISKDYKIICAQKSLRSDQKAQPLTSSFNY